MAFVNEVVPDEIKNKLPFPVQVDADGVKHCLWKWTIDKDKHAALIKTGGGGGGSQGTPELIFYAFMIGDAFLRFLAEPLPIEFSDKGAVLVWKLNRADFSYFPMGFNDDLRDLISSAFVVLGRRYNGDQFFKVAVEFGSGFIPDSTENI